MLRAAVDAGFGQDGEVPLVADLCRALLLELVAAVFGRGEGPLGSPWAAAALVASTNPIANDTARTITLSYSTIFGTTK